MSLTNEERLYRLLPAIYRLRDAAQGEPLRALLGVAETELAALEADIENLYENWFIETCEEWVVPYLGDLLGVRPLRPIEGTKIHTLRAYVANTLAYRRRKGTAYVLEQLARDVTGWPARAVEFFQLLITTQHLNHVRPTNIGPLDLRDPNPLELLESPFTRAAHTADVRHIASGRGRYNIPNVGLFLWRLRAYPIKRGTACPAGDKGDKKGCYYFSPFGGDLFLFSQPRTETDLAHLAEETNVPGRLRRRALYDELEAWRQALADGIEPSPIYFGAEPVLKVFVDHEEEPISPHKILICDLTNWPRPAKTRTYARSDRTHKVDMEIAVAVDPELGRLAFPEEDEPKRVEVSYSYGFSGDLGAGPYDRQDSLVEWLDPAKVTWQIGVIQDSPGPESTGTLDHVQLVKTLNEAITEWNDWVVHRVTMPDPKGFGIIAVMDSHTYKENPVISLPPGFKLAIVAADWPAVSDPEVPGSKVRVIGQLAAEALRPHLRGNLSVKGEPADEDGNRGELILDGLLLDGTLTVKAGDLGGLRLSHCTLVPYKGLVVKPDPNKPNDHLSVRILYSICGIISLPDTVPDLCIANSIMGRVIDAAGVTMRGRGTGRPTTIDALGTDVRIEGSTVIGPIHVRSLAASNSIFLDNVDVERRQVGCVRFSYVPPGSTTPRRYRCQPQLALDKYAKRLGKGGAGDLSSSETEEEMVRLRPQFTSTRYGDPGYAQLSWACAEEIRTGAENGSEMGAFYHLQQPLREANLRIALEEYLRYGMEAGLIYVT